MSAHAEGWDQAEKHSANAIRTGAAYLNDTAIAKRHAENAVRKAAYKEIRAAQKAAAAADRPRREAEKAEKERARQEYYARQAAWAENERLWKEKREMRRKLDEQRKAEWEAAAPARRLQEERHRILASKWVCTECSGKSTIAEEADGYRLTCTKCGKSAWGSHETITKVRQT